MFTSTLQIIKEEKINELGSFRKYIVDDKKYLEDKQL